MQFFLIIYPVLDVSKVSIAAVLYSTASVKKILYLITGLCSRASANFNLFRSFEHFFEKRFCHILVRYRLPVNFKNCNRLISCKAYKRLKLGGRALNRIVSILGESTSNLPREIVIIKNDPPPPLKEMASRGVASSFYRKL